MSRSSRTLELEEVKRKVQESLTEDVDSARAEGIRATPQEGVTPVADPPSTAAAATQKLTDACNSTASEIENAGKAVVEVANRIAAETDALAELLRRHGASITTKIEHFTETTKQIGASVQAVRADLGDSNTN